MPGPEVRLGHLGRPLDAGEEVRDGIVVQETGPRSALVQEVHLKQKGQGEGKGG